MRFPGALLLMALMLSSFAVPLAASGVEATSGRAGPDFAVVGLTLDNGGSVQTDDGIVVGPGSHTIRIEVVNVGTSTGSATLAVTHTGSPTSFPTEVETLNTGMIAPGASASVYLVDWTAATGLSQTLKAQTSSLSDGNTANDDRELHFDVDRLVVGNIIDTVHPEPAPGLSLARLNLGTYDLNASVRNDGVMPMSANMEIVLTSLDGGPTLTFWSNTITVLAAGSLHAPSESGLLTYALDAGSLTGEWNVTMSVWFNSSTGNVLTEAAAFDVIFSEYTAELTVPADRTMQPGASRLFTFTLDNTGAQMDSWNIMTSSLHGWTDTSSWPSSTGALGSGGSIDLVASVTVPITAPRAQTEVFVVTFTSQGASPAYQLQAVLLVTAGELFSATIDIDNSSVVLVPGEEYLINVNVTNTGNVPSNFALSAGFSPNPSGWVARLTSTNTGYIQPDETVVVEVGVTAAHISTPLNPSERNREGDEVDVWVSAQANGGAPVTDAQTVVVAPVVVVDPGLAFDEVVLSDNDVLAAQYGIGFDGLVPMGLEVRHNLINDLDEVLNATVEVSAVRFSSSGGAGGFGEAARWDFVPNPDNVTGMQLGSITTGVLAIQGPADAVPLAGTIEADITVTPTLSGPLTLNGATAAPVTRTLTVVVPGVTDGGIPETDVLTANLGVATTFDIAFENLGNDVSDYRITLMDTLPITWSATLGSNALMTEILNLPSPVATYPSQSTAHQTTFPLTVTSDPLAQAGSITYVDLQVEDLETGEVLQQAQIPVTVDALINGSLTPTYHLVDLSIYDTPLTSLTMKNTGNTPAEFLVELDDPVDEVDFMLTTNDAVLIGAGFSDSIKIEIQPDAEAAADVNYSATVTVTVVGGPVLTAVIQANISAMDDVVLLFAESLDSNADLSGIQHNVVPGTTVVLGYEVLNSGNFVEDLLLEAEIEGGWSNSISDSSLTLAIDQSEPGTLTVTVPALGGSEDLLSGDQHMVRIYVNDSATGVLRSVGAMEVVIAPLFDINSPDWPDELLFHRGLTRTVSAPVINVGNDDIEVLVTVGVFRAGLTVESEAWSLSSAPSQTILLRRNVPTLLDIEITLDELEPTLALQGELRVTLTPTDEDVTGSADLETLLGVSRMFQVEPAIFMPELDDSPEVMTFLWTHIPSASSTAAVYELELCGAERLIDPASVAPSIDASALEWDFVFNTGAGTSGRTTLDLEANGCDGSERITLPLRQAWVLSGAPTIEIDAPDRPNLLPGDGWALTFELHHPDETEPTTATFVYRLDSKADPAFDLKNTLDEVTISGSRLMEGVSTEIRLDLVNYGTSLAVDVQPTLTCEGATVMSEADPIMILAPNEAVTVAWEVVPESFDWWLSASNLRCEAGWVSPYADSFGNDEGNDVLVIEEEVVAWSPRALFVLVGAAAGLFLALMFLALRNQNDNFRLAAVYAGLVGLGFSFHLMSIVWWGPAVLVIAALWTWSMSWRASEEFRVLHEDYQRQRKGLSTIYADHFEALADTQRALSVILAMPIFGFLLIVLGVPAQVPETTENIAVLMAYLIVVSLGVVFLMRRANRTYGRIYGRLTDIETSSARIERDLADPARLLGDLAEDGLGLADLLDEASNAARELSDSVEWNDAEVSDDA